MQIWKPKTILDYVIREIPQENVWGWDKEVGKGKVNSTFYLTKILITILKIKSQYEYSASV